MREHEIVQTADTVKKMLAYFGADQYLDMRRWNWRVDVGWIDIDYTKDFRHPKTLTLVMMSEGGPEVYVQMMDVTLAMIEQDDIEYLAIFDNELRG